MNKQEKILKIAIKILDSSSNLGWSECCSLAEEIWSAMSEELKQPKLPEGLQKIEKSDDYTLNCAMNNRNALNAIVRYLKSREED